MASDFWKNGIGKLVHGFSLACQICSTTAGLGKARWTSDKNVKFHEVLGFWDFSGILGFKVKMHHFEQPARRRVVRKSVECCDFCWISGPQVQLAVPEKLKQSKAVGNSRKQSCVIMPKLSIRHFFAKKNFPRNPIFFWKCNGKQLETVGARTFDSAKKELFKTI